MGVWRRARGQRTGLYLEARTKEGTRERGSRDDEGNTEGAIWIIRRARQAKMDAPSKEGRGSTPGSNAAVDDDEADDDEEEEEKEEKDDEAVSSAASPSPSSAAAAPPPPEEGEPPVLEEKAVAAACNPGASVAPRHAEASVAQPSSIAHGWQKGNTASC